MQQITSSKLKKVGKPNILYKNDNFLNKNEILHYQSFLKNSIWTPGTGYEQSHGLDLDDIKYFSLDLYDHYKWDGQWDYPKWKDSAPIEWENLYNKIMPFLPRHFVHWIDVKITCAGLSGTPIHRDKDPWIPGGDGKKFSRTISIICNLNLQWDPQWGGGLQLYETIYDSETESLYNKEDQLVELCPGQLLIMENCSHSIQPIVERNKSRISFILHVFEYRD